APLAGPPDNCWRVARENSTEFSLREPVAPLAAAAGAASGAPSGTSGRAASWARASAAKRSPAWDLAEDRAVAAAPVDIDAVAAAATGAAATGADTPPNRSPPPDEAATGDCIATVELPKRSLA